MQGHAHVFHQYVPEKIPAVIERYQKETRRLYEVLDTQLNENEYLTGKNYSIADIANWCWVRSYEWAGVPISGLNNLQRWMNTIAERDAVKRGLQQPARAPAEAIVQTVKTML